MLTTDSENYARVTSEANNLERYFPLYHASIKSLRITVENDHLDQPAFFVLIGPQSHQDWKASFSIEMKLTEALKKIDPFRTVYFAYSGS